MTFYPPSFTPHTPDVTFLLRAAIRNLLERSDQTHNPDHILEGLENDFNEAWDAEWLAYARRHQLAGVCRVCGCTDERACADGCTWIEPDLCSTCDRETAPTKEQP